MQGKLIEGIFDREIMLPYYATIDPGQNGYISIWDRNLWLFKTWKMPLIKGKKKIIDGDELIYLLRNVKKIFVESQYTKKKQGGMITNIMNYGIVYHSCVTALNGSDKHITEIPPSSWVPALGLSNKGRSPLLPKLTKRDRIKMVLDLSGYECKSHDEADSILLGVYASKNLI